jgi:hypothetical protein
MEVFPYRRQVMRVAIAHIGHGPDDRDPFRPTTTLRVRSSSVAAADGKPVLVQLGDGMPTRNPRAARWWFSSPRSQVWAAP